MIRPKGSIESADRVQRLVLSLSFMAFIAFGVVQYTIANRRVRMERELQASGMHVDARIANSLVTSDRVRVVLGYKVNGIDVRAPFQVDKQAYNRLSNGKIGVIYSAQDPSIVILDGPGDLNSGSTQRLTALIPIGAGLIPLVGCWIYWIRRGPVYRV